MTYRIWYAARLDIEKGCHVSTVATQSISMWKYNKWVLIALDPWMPSVDRTKTLMNGSPYRDAREMDLACQKSSRLCVH